MVLLRLAYLGVTNAFAMLRLLPMSDREKDAEILALRHQIGLLERQLNGQQVRFHASDRAFLASLLHGLPREVLRRMRLLVRPDTVLRWHRNVIARRHASQSRPKRGGRPRTVHSGRWCCAWPGKIQGGAIGACTVSCSYSGVKVAASAVWEILKEADVDPAPSGPSARGRTSCAPRPTLSYLREFSPWPPPDASP